MNAAALVALATKAAENGDGISTQMVVLALLTLAGSASIAALVTGYFNRPKTQAEAKALQATAGKTIDERYTAWIDTVEERLGTVEADLKNEKRVNAALVVYVRLLRREIEKMGGTPPPVPNEIDLAVGPFV